MPYLLANMKIQAQVYWPVVVDLDVDLSNPYKALEEIFDAAGYILETSMIKPSLESVMALPEHRTSYVDITALFKEGIPEGVQHERNVE